MKTLTEWLFGTKESRLQHELEVTKMELREALHLKQCMIDQETYLRAKINDLQKRAILARGTR